jgi:large subunit ribosomal protein L1
MPKPISPQLDVSPIVKNLRKTIRIRSKQSYACHATVGREEMTPEQIADNIAAVMKRFESKLERGAQNIAAVYVKTTMGPPIRIQQ